MGAVDGTETLAVWRVIAKAPRLEYSHKQRQSLLFLFYSKSCVDPGPVRGRWKERICQDDEDDEMKKNTSKLSHTWYIFMIRVLGSAFCLLVRIRILWMSKFIFSPEALCSARYCNQVADAWELAAGVHWFSLIITHRDYVIDLLGNHSFGNSAALRGAFSRLKSSNEQSIGQAIMSFRFPSSRDQSYAAVHFCVQLSLSPLRLTVACHRRNVSRPHPASRRYSDRPRRSHLMGLGDLIIRKIQSPFLAPVQSNVVEQFTVETLFPFLFPE